MQEIYCGIPFNFEEVPAPVVLHKTVNERTGPDWLTHEGGHCFSGIERGMLTEDRVYRSMGYPTEGLSDQRYRVDKHRE